MIGQGWQVWAEELALQVLGMLGLQLVVLLKVLHCGSLQLLSLLRVVLSLMVLLLVVLLLVKPCGRYPCESLRDGKGEGEGALGHTSLQCLPPACCMRTPALNAALGAGPCLRAPASQLLRLHAAACSPAVCLMQCAGCPAACTAQSASPFLPYAQLAAPVLLHLPVALLCRGSLLGPAAPEAGACAPPGSAATGAAAPARAPAWPGWQPGAACAPPAA